MNFWRWAMQEAQVPGNGTSNAMRRLCLLEVQLCLIERQEKPLIKSSHNARLSDFGHAAVINAAFVGLPEQPACRDFLG
jgi:hypothetical protein